MTAARLPIDMQSVPTVQVMCPYKVVQKCRITDMIHGCGGEYSVLTVVVLGLFGLPGAWHVIGSDGCQVWTCPATS